MKIVRNTLFFVYCLILLNFKQQPCNGLRILGLFPIHVKSHFIMAERLLRTLAEKGHQVDVYSHFPLKKPLVNYADYSLAGTMPDTMNNVTYELILKSQLNPVLGMKEFLELIAYPICNLLELPIFQKLIDNPPKYDLIIGQTYYTSCYTVWSRHLNIPLIDINPNVLRDWLFEAYGNPITPAVLPTLIDIYKEPSSFLGRLQNYYYFTKTSILYKYYSRQQDKIIEKLFGSGYPTVWEMQKDTALTLINHHNSLHGLRPFTPSVIPVSGIHIEEKNESLPNSLQTWLDESKHGFIYVSFGSMVRIETFPNSVVHAMHDAFGSIAPVRVLWKVVKPEELPPNLPKNIMIQKWLQQQEILKHKNIKAFVTHGGLMGTLESVYFGVPMVAIPLFDDQNANVYNYEKKKIAIKVKVQDMKSKFKDALHEIIKNKIYKKNVEKISGEYKDSILKPVDIAIYWIEYIGRHGKNALRSPLVDMPWWQIELLDIYAFLLGTALLAIFIIVKFFRIIKYLFTDKKYNQITKNKKA